MALLLWLFLFLCFFLVLEFVSLLLPPCWWAGMVGEGVGVASSSSLSKVCGFWLPVSAGLQVGWRSLYVCSLSGVLLKGIHKVFFLGGG